MEEEVIHWKGYKLTAYYFPGQTLYHDGLLIERDGTSVFMSGDTLANWGIDDYCSYNRNWLQQNCAFRWAGRSKAVDLPEFLRKPLLKTTASAQAGPGLCSALGSGTHHPGVSQKDTGSVARARRDAGASLSLG
jgi:hypothetical protein